MSQEKTPAKPKPGKRLEEAAKRAGAALAGLLIRALYRTYRVRFLHPEAEEQWLAPGKSVVAASWHRCALILPIRFARLKPAMMVSPSKDGDLLAAFLEGMGYTTMRGSSTRGGPRALAGMIRFMKKGGIAATAADGPKGPPYVAKPGMIMLAVRAGAPLLPVVYSADRAWVLKKTWDRTMIPKPFAKVIINTGRVFRYPAEMSPEALEAARLELQEELNRILAEADQITRHQDPV